MKHGVYAVMDSAAGIFGRIFQDVSDGRAVRNFTDEVNRKEATNAVYAHPSDFTLHRIGFFDDATGVVTDNVDIHTPLCRGKDVAVRDE